MFYLKLNRSIYVLKLLIYGGSSSLDDVNISISSIYLVKNMYDGKMHSARHFSWSIYERASIYTSFYRKPTSKNFSLNILPVII